MLKSSKLSAESTIIFLLVPGTLRLALLHELQQKEKESTAAVAHRAIGHYETALSKLWVLKTLLHLRKENNLLFIQGGYIPLYAGESDKALLAFGRWQNIFTGETTEGNCIPVQAVFKKFPVAVFKPLD